MNPVCERPECNDKSRFIGGFPDSGHYDDNLNWESHTFDETNHPSLNERIRLHHEKNSRDPEFAKAHGTTLYHGTSESNANDIAKNGFHLDNTTNGRHAGEGVYLHHDKREAAKYGTHVVEAKVDDSGFHENPYRDEDFGGVPIHKMSASLAAHGYGGHNDPDDGATVVYNPAHIHVQKVHAPAGKTAAIALDCGDCGERYFTDGEPHGCTQKTADMAGIIGGADDDKKDPRFDGTSLKQDDDGWYVTTHRARSKSYESPEKIPQSKVDFIESTGRIHRPAEGPDGEPADGIMIALVPPKRVIDRLPIPPGGEHPSNVHITLLYLGKITKFTKEQVAHLPEVIEAWGETQRSLKATVQGVGTFSNPGSHVLWAAADIPGGNHMWVSLANTLKSHGYDFHEDHGWTPHLTMSYEKSHVRFIPKVERMEFNVREVWCCIGGTWESFPLRG